MNLWKQILGILEEKLKNLSANPNTNSQKATQTPKILNLENKLMGFWKNARKIMVRKEKL